MKKGIGLIFGYLFILIGGVLFGIAQFEINNNSRYTFTPPYTSYEAEIIITKMGGVILLFIGITWVALLIFKMKYTNSHVEEINSLSKNNTLCCNKCGIRLIENLDVCPRCGEKFNNSAIKSDVNMNLNNMSQVNIASEVAMLNQKEEKIIFCNKCGNKMNDTSMFCNQCGAKVYYRGE